VYSTPQFRADQRSKIMIALEEVLRLVCDDLVPLSSVEYSVADAIGCVSAREVVAREALPGFSNSSMDGFALRAVDTSRGPTRLTVVDTVLAGDVPTTTVNEGEAVRVMTGAPLPDGADCVCMIEETTVDADGQSVMINRSIQVGQFVRRPGKSDTHGRGCRERTGTDIPSRSPSTSRRSDVHGPRTGRPRRAITERQDP
jgi:molybdopterin molybdotransferase